ncbi:MAG: hypothetical protein QXP42_00020, partial [Candidatus Micrarchaeia archaeon]
ESEREMKRKAILRYVDQLVGDLSELAEYRGKEKLKKMLLQLVEEKYSKADAIDEDEVEEEVEEIAGEGELEAEEYDSEERSDVE